jgi:hypothetical protein
MVNLIDFNNDIYLISEYYRLYDKNGDGDFRYFSFNSNSKKAFYPFLINPIVNLGFKIDEEYFDIQGAYGYNGVLSNSNDPEFVKAFYEAFEEYCKENNIIAEFTRFHPLLENHRFSENHMQVVLDRHTVVLDLNNSYEEIWKNEYSSKNRNMIRKAEKLGYTCDVDYKPAKFGIDNFINVYIDNMRAVEAESFYFFSNSFFYDTFELLKDYTYLFNIRNSAGILLSSSIVFKYNNFIHYHLSGRRKDADNSVNNFLLDQVVKFGQNNGAKFFHLGGGRSCVLDDSLLKFKMNFSKTTKPFYIGKKVHNQDVYNEVVKQWEEKYPEKKDKYKNHLLKYRF